VDKYLGDGLMAFWGAPVSIPDAAAVTCNAALAMQAKFEAKKAAWEKKCGRPLSLRAGIEAGATLVGEMGTIHRVNYTVMGEPVAMAFRLEALAKRYDASILVGPQIAKTAGAGFVFREVDTVRLGRGEGPPVQLFELLGRAEDLLAEQPWLELYAKALEVFKARQFAEAGQRFAALLVEHPKDKLLERYVARAAAYVARPPPEGWDGVFSGDEG
jgi:adenylate cyclase